MNLNVFFFLVLVFEVIVKGVDCVYERFGVLIEVDKDKVVLCFDFYLW